MKSSRWEEIYEDLRDQILSGKIPPGSTFPTNVDLIKQYDAHSVTIQAAVNALIRDGLVLSQGKKSPRKVRSTPVRSKRSTGFSKDFGKRARKNILELRMITAKKDLPDGIRGELDPPVLFYHNEQFLDDLLIATSKSYIPDNLPLQELYKLLDKTEPASLYGSFEYLGHKPTVCEEILIADFATTQEKNELHLPKSSSIPVVRIVRKVYDPMNKLIELCHLVYRADCYEFHYRFQF